MFPIRDDNPHFTTPYVTYGLIAANVLAWALLQGLGSEPALSSSVCRLGLIPADVLGTVPAGTSFPISADAACVLEGGTWAAGRELARERRGGEPPLAIESDGTVF